MSIKVLPARPNLEQYKKQAKELVKSFEALRSGASEVAAETMQRITEHHPRFGKLPASELRAAQFALADAQLVIAREHGFESWPKFAKRIETIVREKTVASLADPRKAFLEAACIPRDAWHASGTLEMAEAILAAYPRVANSDIYTVAVLGDDAGVRRLLQLDPGSATAKGGPYGWDALTHLCFSRYLQRDPGRSDGFVRAATALLDAGADANTGWMEDDFDPKPTWESVIYGAAGIAHHAELTRLLLERGADPNDGETPYHAPETHNNDAMKVLVESGKLNDENLVMMLFRKTDFHDYEGLKWLLEHGVDPNLRGKWNKTPIHNAVLSDNHIAFFEALLDHGADPTFLSDKPNRAQQEPSEPKSAVAMAARRGRGDVLALFERRGIPLQFAGVEKLIAACARNDSGAIRVIAEREPQLVRELVEQGGALLSEFAGVGNAEGVRQLLDLGVPVDALNKQGDLYFDVTKGSTAFHSAAWRARHSLVKLLLERGANLEAQDAKGRTPLALAVLACVDSYWTDGRSPESVKMLLDAGASVKATRFPSGYGEVDDLLSQHGAMA
jgi:ankyrin repeat protein